MTGGGWKIEWINDSVDMISLISKGSVNSESGAMPVIAAELTVMCEPQQHSV
jgi:hypothetical protein